MMSRSYWSEWCIWRAGLCVGVLDYVFGSFVGLLGPAGSDPAPFHTIGGAGTAVHCVLGCN